ncbi:MAG: restriction endonuclease subunit S [Bacteroidaceae bacterium]|nr:restriction endonuclease subunit S [Bacteroidaceae bacterium]
MEEWKEYKLGEIGTVVGGATPSTKDPMNYDGDISWITPKDLSGYESMYIDRGERMITQQGYNSCSCKMLPKGSVLFSSRAPIGYVAIAANDLCTNQGFKSVIPNNKIVKNIFLYYLLAYNKNFIEGLGSGTTFKEVSGQTMKNIVVKIPSLSTQERIASILKSLDDKIEVNRRINENLEQQAQALFKSWFVDFEPFRDGEFVESELGMIPKGWKVVTLGDLIEVKYGKDHKKLDNGVIPVYGSGGLMRYVEKSLYSGESVLIPRKGTLNNVMYVNEAFWTVDTMFYSTPKVENIMLFVFIYLRNRDLASLNAGSAVPSMTTEILNNMKVVVPTNIIVNDFNNKTLALYYAIRQYNDESRRLATLRDTLLPKLMSRELKVNDVD